MKEKLNQIIDYFVGKVVDMVLVKVQTGVFDQMISDKIDAIAAEMTGA